MITAVVATFTCSICGEPSHEICVFCTKDACKNHRCERCKRCSDCCECEVPLSLVEAEPEAEMQSAPDAATPEIPEPAPEPAQPAPPEASEEPDFYNPPAAVIEQLSESAQDPDAGEPLPQPAPAPEEPGHER